ncbi:unnamed protein product, partial [marine sediment metagenome]
PGPLPADSTLTHLEPLIFEKQREWIREHLPSYVTCDGKLNRYVLDLLRRHERGFEQPARDALGQVTTQSDKLFIVDLLAATRSDGALEVLGEACEYAGKDAQIIRKAALGCVGGRAEKLRESGDQLDGRLLSKLHGRFNDHPAVRLAAYRALALAADFRSIEPLRNRHASENNSRCKDAICDALNAIKRELIRKKPTQPDVSPICNWLRHVAEMADPGFYSRIVGYLREPHPNPTVQRAALHSIAASGGPDALDAV